MLDERRRHARSLFAGIAASYERPAAFLSLGRYGAWRRALVRELALPRDARVLDVATGTGLVARAIERRCGCRMTGLDQSEPMLRAGGRAAICADANELPLPDARFDAVVFSYLLRYVTEPRATLRELARVLRAGGTLASMEFGVPRARLPRLAWRAYALHVMPALCAPLPLGWREVGSFLPLSIVEWADRWPIERQLDLWREVGIEHVRVRAPTFGAGIILIGSKRG